jgi:hypothetical protein
MPRHIHYWYCSIIFFISHADAGIMAFSLAVGYFSFHYSHWRHTLFDKSGRWVVLPPLYNIAFIAFSSSIAIYYITPATLLRHYDISVFHRQKPIRRFQPLDNITLIPLSSSSFRAAPPEKIILRWIY